MRILVVWASRHGATREIAERIGASLADTGYDVAVHAAEDDVDPAGFDAVVVGGAVYLSHWLRTALRYVRRHEEALARRPVWLFSSGPVAEDLVDADGNEVMVVERPHEFAELRERLEPRDERAFFGARDPDDPPVGLLEHARRVLNVPAEGDAPVGDFRDWGAIDAWADTIAADLAFEPSNPEVHPAADD